MIKYKFLDLFAGIGGIRLGLERTRRFKCVSGVEIDENACETYEANFGDNQYGDITKIDPSVLPKFDLVVGGPPCQAFSFAGNGKGFEDTRGTLFFDVVRIMKHRKPLAGLFENVKGLVSHDGGRTLKTIIRAFEEIGYCVRYNILDAQNFGVPQHRERIYIFVATPEVFNAVPWSMSSCPRYYFKLSIRDIMEQSKVDDKYYLSAKYLSGLKKHKERQRAAGRGFGYEIRPIDVVANAVVCGGMGKERNLIVDDRGPSSLAVDKNDEHVRKLTEREWARLQGFPDTFKLPIVSTRAYKQLGNSVAVPVITAIGNEIANALDAAGKNRPTKTGHSD